VLVVARVGYCSTVRQQTAVYRARGGAAA